MMVEVERRATDLGELEDDGGGGEMKKDVCSLCGDIGFIDALLRCCKCCFRLQHTYCSRMYPEIDMERWGCEWCLHEEEEEKKKKQQQIKESRRRERAFEFLLEIAQSLPPSYNNIDDKIEAEAADNEAEIKRKICSRKEEGGGMATVAVEVDEKRMVKKSGGGRFMEKKNNNNNKAMDRWKNLAKTGLPGGRRRYKLLADVHR